MVITSNSGRNAVPVEMAMLAAEHGIYTIALTSLKHSQSVESRHPSGKRLFEIADLVLDNCAPRVMGCWTLTVCNQVPALPLPAP